MSVTIDRLRRIADELAADVADRDALRAALAEQEAWSVKLDRELTALGDKLREWTGSRCSVSAADAAEILRRERDDARAEAETLRDQVDTLAKENMRLLGELHTERDVSDVEFDDFARNNATLYAELANLRKVLDDRERQIANQDQTIDVLAKTNAGFAAQVSALQADLARAKPATTGLSEDHWRLLVRARQRTIDERDATIGQLTAENARLRSKVPTHVADVAKASEQAKDQSGEWAWVEIMGHREHYGQVTRIDDPSGTLWCVRTLDGAEHYYGLGAIFGIHPCSEEEVRKQADDGAPF